MTCTKEEFGCSNGVPHCIPKTWVCDGDRECTDGSDEELGQCGKNNNDLSLIWVTLLVLKCSFRRLDM